MKAVLTIQLQQDNGTPVITGTQTKTAFVGDDIEVVKGFIGGESVKNLIRMMGWIADGQLTVTGTPTLTISSLK